MCGGAAGAAAGGWPGSSPRTSDSGRGDGAAIAERRIAELRAKLTLQTTRTDEALARVRLLGAPPLQHLREPIPRPGGGCGARGEQEQ